MDNSPAARTGRERGWLSRLQASVGLLLILTGITGLAYPLVMTAVADLSSPSAHLQSLVVPGEEPYGLAWGAPLAADPRYFRSQPVPGGTESPAAARVSASQAAVFPGAPDARIALAAAYAQAPRVARRRGLPLKTVRALITARAMGPDTPLKLLDLNLALDRLGPRKTAQITVPACDPRKACAR